MDSDSVVSLVEGRKFSDSRCGDQEFEASEVLGLQGPLSCLECGFGFGFMTAPRSIPPRT